MSDREWGTWPPKGFKTIEEYVALMDQTGLWGSKEYAENRIKGIRLDKLRQMRDKHRLAPIAVFYPINWSIEDRTKPQ